MLRIGTDCSGIEAPVQALQQLKIPFKHVFSCEKDSYAVKSIKANYTPEKMYTDITKRKHALLPDMDVYVCGFPCQPFSLMGNKMGTDDARSNIMYQCIKVIKRKLPKVFILENVKNFKFIQNGQPFQYLINELTKIKATGADANACDANAYNIYHDILNTKDYGIPQNRERIFIIGILKDIQKKDCIYSTPEKIQMKPLDDFIIDKTVCDRILNKNGTKILKKFSLDNLDTIISCCGFGNYMYNLSPTLTTRCDLHYHTKYKRYLTTKECLLLQGFAPSFIQVVSNSQMYKQIGNSMSVNVLKEIFKRIFSITIIL
jgi:DNA (cytosine-5)-methyltransferase 1